MRFRRRTLSELADLICGNEPHEHFIYRSRARLVEFFQDADAGQFEAEWSLNSRQYWTANILEQILAMPWQSNTTPPEPFARVISLLMDAEDATNESGDRAAALTQLNDSLRREGLEAFYAPDKKCHLRHVASGTTSADMLRANPHRPFSTAEIEKRERLAKYLDGASEDQLIEEVLLPLFRQLGFHRITAAGHKDKAQEYGKDIWMRYQLPTQHFLYFGIQAKKGKLDSAG